MKKWPHKRGGLSWGGRGGNLVVFYYFTISVPLKSGLIKGVVSLRWEWPCKARLTTIYICMNLTKIIQQSIKDTVYDLYADTDIEKHYFLLWIDFFKLMTNILKSTSKAKLGASLVINFKLVNCWMKKKFLQNKLYT